MSMRRWMGVLAAATLLCAWLGIVLAVSPGLLSRALRTTRPLRAAMIEALACPAAHAGETLQFKSVPPESGGSLERRAKLVRRARAAAESSLAGEAAPPQVATPVPPVPPPGVILSRSGDVMRVGSDITIKEDEVVKGDVSAIAGDVKVYGHVEGNVVSMVGDIYLSSTARVDGDVVCMRGELHEEPGAQVTGQRVTAMGGRSGRVRLNAGDEEIPSRHHYRSTGHLVGAMIWLFIVVGIAWLVAKLTPGSTSGALAALKREPLVALGMGGLTMALLIPSLVALCLVVALLCITIIGIPLGLAALIGYFLFLAAIGIWGFVVGAAVIGDWLGGKRRAGPVPIGNAAVLGALAIFGLGFFGLLLRIVGRGSPLHGFGVLFSVLSWILFASLTLVGSGAWLRHEFQAGVLGQWWGRRRRGAPAPAPASAWGGAPAGMTPVAVPEPVAPPPPPPPPPSPPESYMPPPGDPPATT